MSETTARPPSTRIEDVVQVIHGHRVPDPYRWLEDGDSSETKRWVEEQNAYTRSILDSLPGRRRLAEQLQDLLSIDNVTTPAVRQGRYFFERRQGDQNQPILYLRQDGVPDRALIDPNELSPDGTIALDWWYPSRHGELVAYGLSTSGDERSTLHVLDVDGGTMLPDTIRDARAASVSWLLDGSGFYYTRYPAAGEAPPGEENYHRQVYCHRIGDDPAHDLLIFGEGRDPTDWPSVSLSTDGRYLMIVVSRGWDRSDCYLRPETPQPGPFVPLIESPIEQEGILSSVQMVEETVYLHTNLGAPRYRLFAIDPARPSREHWHELVAEHPSAVLEDVHVGGGRLLLTYLDHASSRLEVRDLNGDHRSDVLLPGLGSVGGVSGEWDGDEAYFAFTSFTTPTRIFRYAIATGSLSVWASVEARGHTGTFTVRQVDYPSKDGTSISMFVVARDDLRLDGTNPALLTGYGGFNISLTPAFSSTLSIWLERGGVYAVPNLRGGGEYGEHWHEAGMLGQKQNVFDDFIAAAEYLCRAGYTNHSRLSISGGSNGGLLIGAAVTQRPDLFRAAICAVPLLDMLRYHNFQIARLWIAEYGSAEDPEQFEWLNAYSPYHHVRDGTRYPAILLLSGDSDTRVDPLHARKMAARLQAASASGLPVLLRVETDAGHGAGRPLAKTLAEQTDVWSFRCWQLGVPIE